MRRLFLAVTVAAAVLVTGCSRSDGDQQTGGPVDQTLVPPTKPSGVVDFGLAAEIDGFLPATSRWSQSGFMMARAVLDPLMAFDADGVARPYLAADLRAVNDYATWILDLRGGDSDQNPGAGNGVRFHDGTPLTADVVVANLQQAKDSPLTGAAWEPVQSITATGPLTVQFEMNIRWVAFPQLLTGQTGFIISESQMAAGDAQNPVGTGPFVLKERRVDDETVMTRNTQYWRYDRYGTRLPYLDSVTFRPIPDEQTRVAALQAGDITMMHSNAADTIVKFDDGDYAPDIQGTTSTGDAGEYTLILRTNEPPFDDKTLRVAAASAVDRQALADTVFNGVFPVANGPYSQDGPWGEPSSFPGFDPEKAKELVNEWKAANGGVSPQVRLVATATPAVTQAAQFVKEGWDAAGFDVQIETVAESAASANLVAGQFSAFLFDFYDRPDPDGLYHYWHSSSIRPAGEISLNWPAFSNEDFDKAINLARTAPGGNLEAITKSRRDAYRSAWDVMAEEVPWIWLVHTRWVMLYRESVHGFDQFTLPDGQPAMLVVNGSGFLTTVWTGTS